MRIKYKSWISLFNLWANGQTDIAPCRSRWPYFVKDDILIFGKGSQKYAVGIPATPSSPRLFYYLVSHWRERMVDRERIESSGGIPIMPFELMYALIQMDRGDLAPLCRFDVHEDDQKAFLFVQKWVSLREGMPNIFHEWREYGISSADGGLHVTRWGKRRQAHTTRVVRWDGKDLQLLSQAYRSPSVNWVKDAVYVATSRANGLGAGLTLKRMGNVLLRGNTLSTEGTVIPVASTPSFLIQTETSS